MLAVAVSAQRGSFSLNVRFAAPTPGVVALFGRSGCGKSSVVNIISGLVQPREGSVALDDVVLLDVSQRICVPPEQRRIGYVFQDARLFPHLSVAANLEYALQRAAGPHFVSLTTVTTLLGLAHLMHRRTHQLSGGERQRVAIGRALLVQPRLLLLDEPLAALDGARREDVLPYLETLRDQLAIPMVYVTHDFGEVLRLATHLVLMDAGTVIGHGEVAQMSLDPRLRALIGPDEVGAIIDGVVVAADADNGLVRVRVGRGELQVQAQHVEIGAAIRVQILARDVIVSTQPPQQLSVRNSLAGVVAAVTGDDASSDLVTIDIGDAYVLARITKSATRDLSLRAGTSAWALVKTVSLRGRSFARSRSPHPP